MEAFFQGVRTPKTAPNLNKGRQRILHSLLQQIKGLGGSARLKSVQNNINTAKRRPSELVPTAAELGSEVEWLTRQRDALFVLELAQTSGVRCVTWVAGSNAASCRVLFEQRSLTLTGVNLEEIGLQSSAVSCLLRVDIAAPKPRKRKR